MSDDGDPKEIKSVRRFYLLKRRRARELCEPLEGAWQAKQEAEPGAALPATFPYLTELAEHGYTTVQDLDGANVTELGELGFSTLAAEAILAALEPLL